MRTSFSRAVHSAHRTSQVMGAAVDLVEVGGTAFAWGAVHGRYGVIAPMGVSLDLILGSALGIAGMFDAGGPKVAPHLLNLGVGSLASFCNRKGVQAGTKWRAGAPITNHELPGQGLFGGEFARMHGGMPVANSGAGRISDAELSAMSAAATGRR